LTNGHAFDASGRSPSAPPTFALRAATVAPGAVADTSAGKPASPRHRARARIVPAGESYTTASPSCPGMIRPRSSAIVVTAMTPCPHMVL
jgi:hypothetical protein